jgi:hypothetical protein
MTSDYIVYSRFHEVVRTAHLARLARQQREQNQMDWLTVLQRRQSAWIQPLKAAWQPTFGRLIKATAALRLETITTRFTPYFRS